MIFEVHITVETTDVPKFKTDCEMLGVKPIVIETERDGNLTQQVMTSGKYINASPINILTCLVRDLTSLGYKLIRLKVEKYPDEEKDADFIYYETHFRLKLKKDFDRSMLVDLCKEQGFHLSRNLFKSSLEFNYQMITYRDYEIGLPEFNSKINEMKGELDKLGVIYDKIEIEECIYDTNIDVDKDWLK